MRRLGALALGLTLLAAACGGGTGGGGGGPAADTGPKAPGKDGKPAAKITWGHAHGGINGEALNGMVASFNKGQGNIRVEADFKGWYEDRLARVHTSRAPHAPPAL